MPLAGIQAWRCPVSGSPEHSRASMSDGQETTAELEKKIRELCSRAIVTEDEEELRALFVELRAAMHEKMRRGRIRLAEIQAAEKEISKRLEPESQ